jgi:putative FmdB family regulatory protein
MPTYDYHCDACEHEFEVFESIKAEPQSKCPKCKKKKLRRLFGAGGGLLFKGSGFYLTDYRSESYKQAAAKEKPDAATSSTTAETKSSSKPAAPAKNEAKTTQSDA